VADYPITSAASAGPLGLGRQRRSRRSRLARGLAIVMIAAGSLAVIDGAITLLWQEPISALIARLRQDHLNGDLRNVELAPPTALEARTLSGIASERRRVSYLAGQMQRHTSDGSAVGRITIPRIGARFVIVKGTGTEELESGPGIYGRSTYQGTAFPGAQGATTAIAGHRTTYLAPFRHVDELQPGNVIRLDMPYAHLTYTVIGHRVVSPYDVQAAIGRVGYSRLVLSACTPLFSAEKRLLVFARLTRTVPEGAARLLTGGVVARPIEAHRNAQPRQLPPVLESLDPHRITPIVQ
jgi:sortase A